MRQGIKNSSNKNIKNLLPTSTRKHTNLSFLLYASATFVLLQASVAHANPTGANVVAGGVSISTPQADKLVVNQSTDKAIINWNNFDILNGESTQFVQPSSDSVALNRITDGNPTQILGDLSANGKLMVVNPNGVFFGSNSQVDVAGLVTSTADTSDGDFMAGKINLSVAGKPDASIVNKGHITATDGGLVALVAPNVRNDGIIQANMGTVALASAETASIDFYGDNLYSFALGKETTAVPGGETSAVTNSGIISVDNGKVLLTAKVAKGVVDNVINNTGVIEAVSSHMEGGTIVLDGGNGNVNVSGTLNASGITGGKVAVTGENITLAAADINASGKNGGGTVKIGGDYQGKGSIPHAKTVKVDTNSKINVSAVNTGNGGTSVIWSDEGTNFKGTILGTGGVNGGDGGLAEVSSKGSLGYDGFADLHATSGNAGTLLLDPHNLFLGNIGDFVWFDYDFVNVVSIVSSLNAGTNVVQEASNNISVLGDIIWSGLGGSLTLNAGNNMYIEADIKSSFSGTPAQGAVNLNAGNNIYLGGADIATNGGDINATSNDFNMSFSTMKSALGNVIINNNGKFAASDVDVLEGQFVSLYQNADGSIGNAIGAISNVSTSSLLQLRSGTWNEDFAINNKNNFTLKGNGIGDSFINAQFPAFSNIAVVNGGSNVTISDLSLSGGAIGVNVLGGDNFKLDNVRIRNTFEAGLQLNNTNDALITGNIFSDNNVGISAINTNFTEIMNNNQLYNNFIGMNFDGDTNLTIKDNYFAYNYLGIGLLDVVGAPITGNVFDYTNTGILANGGSSLVIDDNDMNYVGYGIIADNSVGIKVTNNYLFGGYGYYGEQKEGFYEGEYEDDYYDGYGIGSYGIHITNGLNSVVSGNTVDNFEMGIGVETSIHSGIFFNEVINIMQDAIFLNENNHTVAFENIINNATNGIHALSNSNTDITGNDISDADFGILADGNSFLSVLDNKLYDNFIGGDIINSNAALINNNKISNNIYGLIVENSHDVNLNTNNFTDNGTGAAFYDSNNAILTGDVFAGNVLGINLNNSKNVFIREASITSPSASVGMLIENGSDGTLVRGLNITGGGVGVLLDGAGSSMQFSSNTSQFTGQTRYFILQNNAMFGQTLDASAQIFDGIRASDFTVAQRDAAEFITTDVEDSIPTIGNVFYKDFITVFNTDGLIPTQEFPFDAGRFSYAGRTINNDPGVTPPTYYIAGLNLSLLSPTAGGVGGNPTGLTPNQLGGLEPAAGGDNSQALASLEPAAGSEANCGNNFLGSGFNNNFDPASCSIKQQ